MPYVKQVCKAGRTKEYEFYYSYRYDQKGGSRRKKEERTKEAQKKVNRRQAERKLTWILNANFSGEDDYLTLSYRKEERPDKETLRKDVRSLLKHMRKEWRERGKELRYVWTAEKGERGAVHIHMVVNGVDNISHIIRDLWKKGWISIKPLDRSGNYWRLANYFIKYSDKTMKTEEGYINKRYCSSKNLKIPEPKKTIVKSRNAYSHKIDVPPGWYVDKESIREAWHDVTGYMYFSYTLVQMPDTKTAKERSQEETYTLHLETGEVRIRERRGKSGRNI